MKKIEQSSIMAFAKALSSDKSMSANTTGTVVRSDEEGIWVVLEGSEDATPMTSSTVAVAEGDEVMVRIDGGNAVVTGNISRPSTDDSALNVLERVMDTFKRRVSDLNGNVSEIRQSADSIATRVENVEGSVASMENTAEGWSWVTSVKNQAAAANTAAEKAATDAANAQSSADEAAKTATNYMSFTGNGLIVGDMTKDNLGRNVCINDGGVHVFYEGSTEGVNEIAHLGYGEGNAQSGTANAPYYTFGGRKTGSAIGNYSVVEGAGNTASAMCSHAEGYLATASGVNAHAEGSGTTASGGASHAEGGQTTASNNVAHAEGSMTVASGYASHAEGYETKATGEASHAEGRKSQASGLNSHASGLNTRASSDNQTAIGKYNVEDTEGKYAFIVGNGTSTARSNAFTVDWDGNAVASGSITSGDMCYVSHGKANADAMTNTTRTDTGRSVAFGVGAGGTNAGVYDNNKSKWLLHADNDNTYLNGACVDVTSSTTASDFFTHYSTNVKSVNSGQVSRWGKICQVHVSVDMKTAISAGNITNTKIGTLKSGYRPNTIAALTSGTAGPVCSFHVDTDGSVYVDATHSAVSAGSSISFGGTFILA